MGPDELPKHGPSGMSELQQQQQQHNEAYYNTLGIPLEQLSDTQQQQQQPQQQFIHSSSSSTFAYPSSNVIRFASKREQQRQQQPDSFENFDFSALPSTTAAVADPTAAHERTRTNNTYDETSSHEQPIPHSSGLTTISNMTSDDSATLIGRSNTHHLQLHHQPLQTTQEYPSPTSPTSPHSLSSPPPSSPHYEQQHQQHPIKTPSPIITHNIDNHHHQQQQQHHHYTNHYQHPSQSAVSATAAAAVAVIDRPMDTSRQMKLVRNYKLFPGRNKFFCGGRLMTSREYWAFILALVLLIAPSVLFGIFTCPFIWEHVHPAIPIVFAYLFVLSLTSMIKTSWTDPGIIPRDLDPFPVLERYDDPGSPYSESMWQHGIPSQKEVRIKDKTWTLRYCETCRIYRPPRASHCRQCDNCVEVEDHHCIWLNNCIGSRNYRPFFVFINTATLLCLFVIVFSIVHLLLVWREQSTTGQVTFNSVFNAAPVSFVLAIVCLILLLMVGGLTLYHCSLILRGITTHEQLRASVMTKHSDLSANPYNKENPVLNMATVLCRPRPKSYLRRRKYSPAH